MRMYMQSNDYADQAPKYLQLVLQQDLLEGWSLVCESGQQGGRGRIKQEHFATHEQAMEALLALRDKHIKKGFRVVFLQGEIRD